MAHLEITSSVRDAYQLNNCFSAYEYLRDNFEFEGSDTIVSIQSFNTDDEEGQDAIDEMENECNEIFHEWGAFRDLLDFRQVED